MRLSLTDFPFLNRTGAGIRVAIIDSGVHASHPHVGGVVGGTSLVDQSAPSDFVDRIGHGTAVAGAIREKSPGIELLVARVFDRELRTSAAMLAGAIVWSADQGARIINLSLGTANRGHAAILTDAISHATALGSIVVSARESGGVEWLPGSLPHIAGVIEDRSCERDQIGVETGAAGVPIFRASGLPRPIPGVPPERNLSGVSFAVANVTGFLARLLEAENAVPEGSRQDVWRPLGFDRLLAWGPRS